MLFREIWSGALAFRRLTIIGHKPLSFCFFLMGFENGVVSFEMKKRQKLKKDKVEKINNKKTTKQRDVVVSYSTILARIILIS